MKHLTEILIEVIYIERACIQLWTGWLKDSWHQCQHVQD